MLALVAILVVPLAAFADTTGGTEITGTFVAPSLSITVPGTFGFGDFAQEWNYAGPGDGNVTFSQGSSQYTGWSMTALGDSNMSSGGTPLTNYLLISSDNLNWLIANGGGPATIGGNSYGPGTLTYTGGVGVDLPFSLYAAQYIVPGDQAGAYSITITFTASMTP